MERRAKCENAKSVKRSTWTGLGAREGGGEREGAASGERRGEAGELSNTNLCSDPTVKDERARLTERDGGEDERRLTGERARRKEAKTTRWSPPPT